MHRFGRVGRSVRTARAGEYIRSPTLPLSYTFAIELLLRDCNTLCRVVELVRVSTALA
jgi:hypothetical protein